MLTTENYFDKKFLIEMNYRFIPSSLRLANTIEYERNYYSHTFGNMHFHENNYPHLEM